MDFSRFKKFTKNRTISLPNKSISLFIVFFAVISFNVHSQEVRLKFNHLTLKDGLQNLKIQAIKQDQQGFIWIGTQEGLHKFDSYEFQVYLNDINNLASIKDNDVRDLAVDADNNLWIGTNSGLELYDRKNDAFIHIPLVLGSDTIKKYSVTSICQTRNGEIFIGPKIYRLDKSKSVVESVYTGSNLGANTISSSDKDGNLWMASTQGAYKFNPATGETTHFKVDGEDDKNIASNLVLDILVDGRNNVWLATGRGLNRIDGESRKMKYYGYSSRLPSKVPSTTITKLYEDNLQNIWICSEYGLFQYISDEDKFIPYFSNSKDNTSLSTNRINCAFLDNEGILWVGTQTMGIDFTPLNDPFHFENIYAGMDVKEEFGRNAITEIYKEKNGSLWIATDGSGVSYYNAVSGTRALYSQDLKNAKSISTNSVLSIIEDRNGDVWLGGFLGGINKYDRKTGLFESFSISENSPEQVRPFSNEIKYMIEGEPGELLIATNGSGLVIFDTRLKSFRFILHDPNNPNSICSNLFTSLFKDSENNIWIGTYNGVSKWNREDNKFTNYIYNQDDSGSIPGNSISSIIEDSNHNIWIGTNNGLCMIDRETGVFDFYTKEDGLLSESINDILEDNEGNVWVSTNNGISRINKYTKLIRPFKFNFELQVSQFSKSCSFKDDSGNLYFGLTDGFIWFNPKEINEIQYKSPLYITELQLFNKPLDYDFPYSDNNEPDSAKENVKRIELKYNQSFITFKYVALNYLYPFQTNYAYKLDGFDDDWHYVGNERSATYTNLSPGTYTFKVKAGSESQVWESTAPGVKILIRPPVWKTNWAYSVYAILLIVILIAVFRFLKFRNDIKKQVEIERIKAEEQHKTDMFKLQFFTNVSHEIRTPLTLILGPTEQLKKNIEKKAKPDKSLINIIHQNSLRLLDLVNQLLDYRKLGAGSETLDLVYDDIAGHIVKAGKLFQSLAQNKKIDFIIHAEPEILYTCFDPEKMERIVGNLISNAIKFTSEKGAVELIIEHKYAPDEPVVLKNTILPAKEYVKISVKDTGRGINDSEKSKVFNSFYQASNNDSSNNRGFGIGLAMAKEYVTMHNGIITVTDNVNPDTSQIIGACLIVLLPVTGCPDNATPLDELLQINNPSPGNQDNKNIGEEIYSEDEKSDIPVLLVVEDNPDMRYYIHQELADQFKVVEAVDGRKGYEEALKLVPDLIITDYLMPDVSGIELCKSLKTNLITSHIPVILLTALSEDEYKIEGLETGADDYIIKPFNPEILRVRINNLIDSRKKLQEKYQLSVGLKNKAAATNTTDRKFLDHLFKIIEKELDNPNIDVRAFTREIGMSKTQLYKKIKAITGQTLFEFINTIRLKKGAEILLEEDITISEVAHRVGFSSLSVFTRSFTRQFKINPSKYSALYKSGKK